jgi:superfamily II DNA helicase RecQ
LVVTPLISLMEDQVGRAREAGLRAAHLSAGQDPSVRHETVARARSGDLQLLFVAPERLVLDGFLGSVGAKRLRLLAVDEAHCISEWGNDFRPAYREIGRARTRTAAPVLALTATATPRVREDISDSLGLRNAVRIVGSFDRPNLSWIVCAGGSLAERAAATHDLLRRVRGPAVVYAPTRRTVDEVRDILAGYGVVTEAYHAGLRADERSRVQGVFMEGRSRVVVATNAFGMGIDKANVRLVVHTHLPGTLESYYQEGGRAGRDGEPAWCVSFRGRGDERVARSFIDRSHPPARVLRTVYRALRLRRDCDGVVRVTVEELRGALGPAAVLEDVFPVLSSLRRVGVLVPLGGGAWPMSDGTAEGPEGSQIIRVGVRSRADLTNARHLRRAAQAKLGAVRRYAETRGCRRRALLAYFGEEAPRRCGGCDRCRAGRTFLPD